MRCVQLLKNGRTVIYQYMMLRRKIVDHPTNLGNKHISSLCVPSVLDLPARLHKPTYRRLHPLQVVINFAKAMYMYHIQLASLNNLLAMMMSVDLPPTGGSGRCTRTLTPSFLYDALMEGRKESVTSGQLID